MAHAWDWDFGNWYVRQIADPDGQKRTIAALRNDPNTDLFVVRCIDGTLDLVLSDPLTAFRVGDQFTVTVRGDNYAPVEAAGSVIDDHMVEFRPTSYLLGALLASHTVALQYVNKAGVSVTHTWQAGGAVSALSWVQKECPFK
jgi:hypothetical protein